MRVPAARGAAPLAPPLRRRLRVRRVRPRRSGLRRSPGTALPALARARSLATVHHVDLRTGTPTGGAATRSSSSTRPASHSWGPRSGPRSSGDRRSRRSIASCAASSSSPPASRPTSSSLAWSAIGGSRYRPRSSRSPCPPTCEVGWRPGSGGACSRHAWAFAWLPLLALALRPWVEGGRTAALGAAPCRPGAPVPPVHPPVSGRAPRTRGSAALLARPGRRTVLQAVATGGFTLLLTAFWACRSWSAARGWSRWPGATCRSGFPATSRGGRCSWRWA